MCLNRSGSRVACEAFRYGSHLPHVQKFHLFFCRGCFLCAVQAHRYVVPLSRKPTARLRLFFIYFHQTFSELKPPRRHPQMRSWKIMICLFTFTRGEIFRHRISICLASFVFGVVVAIGFLIFYFRFLFFFSLYSGHCGYANWPRIARFGVQPGQDDHGQALLRVQGALPGPEATGFGHVLARLEVQGELIGKVILKFREVKTSISICV